MRVLIITVRADFGGGPEHVYQLMKNSPEEAEYFVACPSDRPYYVRFQELLGKDRIIEIPHRRFNLKSLYRIYQFAGSNCIQLVHSHGKGAGIYSRPLSAFLRVPCVHTFHGLHIGTYGPVGRTLYIFFERCLSLFTDKIISVSRGESESLIEKHAAGKQRIRVIPNGVIIPDKNNYDYNTDGAKPVKIIAASRFDYQKNPELITDIALNLKKFDNKTDYLFEVLGTGENFNEMQRLIKERGLLNTVRLVGAVEDPRKYYQNSLCFLSTSRWEGMPLAPLEAMSEGVPVIASDVVGNNDIIIHNETGLLYGLDEPLKAAEFIADLAGSNSNRARLSRNSYDSVKKLYNVKIMAQRTVELYRNILYGS